MPLAERADRRFANGRKRLGKQIFEPLTICQPLPESLRLAAQIVIRQPGDGRLEIVVRIDIFAEPGAIAVVGRSEDALCQSGDHEIPLKTRALKKGENPSPSLWETAPGDVRGALAVVN